MVAVAPAPASGEPVQRREDPFVRGLELARLRLVEGGDESVDVPELRHELRRAADFRFVDAEVVSRVRLARNENPDCVGTVFLDQRPRVDHVPNRPVHRVPAGIEAEAMDEYPVERLRPPNEPRLEHRVVEPRPDDLTAMRPKRERAVRGEEVRVAAVTSE